MPFETSNVLSRALRLVRRAIEEGRAAMQGIPAASPAPSSLELALSSFLKEVPAGRGVRLRIFVQGKPWPLSPAIQEQLFLIGREAVMNALRHSNAANIEIELQYPHSVMRMSVRDNGCGIDGEAVQKVKDAYGGLRGVRERAENIGARFEIWGRAGSGKEGRVAVPVSVAVV